MRDIIFDELNMKPTKGRGGTANSMSDYTEAVVQGSTYEKKYSNKFYKIDKKASVTKCLF